MRYYFVPQDAKYESFESVLKSSISQRELQEWLAGIPALRSILIYDTCESGSNAEDSSAFHGEQQLVAVEKLSQSMGRTVLAATTDTGDANEGYKRHGVFTYVILDALSLADSNKDGRIEVRELADYLTVELPAVSQKADFGRQIPQIKITGSDFALVNKLDKSDVDRVRN